MWSTFVCYMNRRNGQGEVYDFVQLNFFFYVLLCWMCTIYKLNNRFTVRIVNLIMAEVIIVFWYYHFITYTWYHNYHLHHHHARHLGKYYHICKLQRTVGFCTSFHNVVFFLCFLNKFLINLYHKEWLLDLCTSLCRYLINL